MPTNSRAANKVIRPTTMPLQRVATPATRTQRARVSLAPILLADQPPTHWPIRYGQEKAEKARPSSTCDRLKSLIIDLAAMAMFTRSRYMRKYSEQKTMVIMFEVLSKRPFTAPGPPGPCELLLPI